MNLNSLQIFLYQVTNSLHVPISAALLIEIFSSLQIIQLIFSSMAMFSPSSHFIITSFNRNLCFLTGAFPLSEASIYNSMFLGIWICCLIYFVIHIGLLLISLILSKSHQNHGGRRVIEILSWLYLLHSRIIFFPMQFFLLSLCNLYSSPKDASNVEFYQRTGWLIGSVLLLIVNASLALCKEFIMYKINQTEDHYAVKTNMYHQLILVYKVIALLLYFWGVYGTSAATKGSAVFHFIMTLLLMSTLYMKLPFYTFRVLRLTIVLTTVILCLSLISLIYVFVAENSSEGSGGMHILILLLPPLGIKLSLSRFRSLFKRILQGEFMIIDHAIHFGLLLEDFVRREKNNLPEDKVFLPNSESYYGVLALDNRIPLENFRDRNLIGECELPIYVHIVERLSAINSNSKLLSLYIAQISLVKLNNIPKAFEILRKLESSSNSSNHPMKSSIQYINELLAKVYNEDDGMGSEARLGLSHYFKYYDIANSIKALMLTETKKQIEFWEEIKKRDLDAKKIYDKVEEIDKIFVRIRKECELNLNNFRKNFTSPMLLYSVYLNNVRQMHYEGMQVLRSFQAIMFAQNTNNELEAAYGNVAVVIVSLDKAKAGIILNASGSIHNIFNLKKTELIGKKVGCLFPSSIAKGYQQNIQQYAKSPESQLDYKEKTYGKTKNDEIFELEAHFQLYPYVNKELTLMVMLKKLDDPAPLLIANNEGHIVDYSTTLEVLFQRESLNVKVFQSLQNLLPKFEDINLAFNVVYNPNPQQSQSVQSTAIKDNKSWFNFDHTAADIEETSRWTRRSLLHRTHFTPERMKKCTPKEMPFDKAEFICEEYLEGKKVFLNTEALFQRKCRLRAHVNIRPFRAEEEVYKVVRISNLKKDLSSFSESSDENSVLTFGDEFPVENEKVRVDQVSPSKIAKTKRAIGSPSTDKKNKKASPIKSESENQRTETQKKLDDIQPFQHQDDLRSSIMSSHHIESRTVRTLREIGSRKKLQRGLGSLQISLFIVIAIVLALSFAKFELSKSSIEEIERGVNIINFATLRLQNAINAWMWSLTYITGVTAPEAQRNLTITMAEFNESSVKLKNELGLVKDKDFLNRAFQKDITFWQLVVQDDDNEIVIDTFTATDILMAKYLAIQNTQVFYQAYMMPDLALIFNNTANDYIISSNNLIAATDAILEDLISSDIRLLEVVLSIEVVGLVGYILIFLTMILIIRKSYQRLCRALLRTRGSSIIQRISQLHKVKILLEDDIERKAFIQDGFDLFIEQEQSLAKAKDVKAQNSSHQPNVQISSMTKYLIRITIICLLFIPIFAGLFIGTLVKSIHTFNSLASVNEELSVLSDGSLQSNLIMSTLVYTSVFGDVPNMLVMNKDPRLQIVENLVNFNNLNEKLIKTFLSSKEREIDPFLVEILKNDVCENLSSVSKELCVYASTNQKMGLLNINNDYYNELRSMFAATGSGITLAEVVVVFANVLNKLTGEMSAMIEIYPIMMSHILEGFERTVGASKNDEENWIRVIFIIVIVYMIFVYLKPLKDFRKVDVGRRKILKILPVGVIQENKALKFYLMQDFKTEIEGIKNNL